MGILFKAATGFSVAAWLLGTGPFAGPPDPHWDTVRAELAVANPRARLVGQLETLFPAGKTPAADTPSR